MCMYIHWYVCIYTHVIAQSLAINCLPAILCVITMRKSAHEGNGI